MNLHEFLDVAYGEDGDDRLRAFIDEGTDVDRPAGPLDERPIHVASRRRRPSAVSILADAGADVDAKNGGGKTAFAHAVRRGFFDVVHVLRDRGADQTLNAADRLAVAIVAGRLDDARALIAKNDGIARTGNPEEDRLLADVAGRNGQREALEMLIAADADLEATGLDSGTALHQAAWFGQPDNARLLVDAGAPLEIFDATHKSSPLGWAVHGSAFSGGADEREPLYVELVELLLEAGASLHYPTEPDGDAYVRRLLGDASPRVADVLRRHRPDVDPA